MQSQRLIIITKGNKSQRIYCGKAFLTRYPSWGQIYLYWHHSLLDWQQQIKQVIIHGAQKPDIKIRYNRFKQIMSYNIFEQLYIYKANFWYYKLWVIFPLDKSEISHKSLYHSHTWYHYLTSYNYLYHSHIWNHYHSHAWYWQYQLSH